MTSTRRPAPAHRPANALYFDGERFMVRCEKGHKHYGEHGAAGLLLAHRDASGRVSVLLQARDKRVHNGGTYGWLGGAVDDNETRLQAARREAREEAGLDALPAPSAFYVAQCGDWSYTTFLVLVDEQVETDDIWEGEAEWFALEDALALNLTPGAKPALVTLTDTI